MKSGLMRIGSMMEKADWKRMAIAVMCGAGILCFNSLAAPIAVLFLPVEKKKRDIQAEIETHTNNLVGRLFDKPVEAARDALVKLAREGKGNEEKIRTHFQNLIKDRRTDYRILDNIPLILKDTNSKESRSDLMEMATSGAHPLHFDAVEALASLATDKKVKLPPNERQNIVDVLHGVLNHPLLQEETIAQLKTDRQKKDHISDMHRHATEFISAARYLGEMAAAGNLSIKDCNKALSEAQNLLKRLETYVPGRVGRVTGREAVEEAIGILDKEISRRKRSAVPKIRK